MEFHPSIAPEIFALRPDYMALSITVEGASNPAKHAFSSEQLAAACRNLASASWAAAHLDAWREAYRAFGAKPQRTPCSAEALRKRCERDGQLQEATAVVDLYNAISLAYAIPVGGEDASTYQGAPQLVRATGEEMFDTVADGLPKLEKVDKGEVVWRDGKGVTCRRWNWRQGTRTRITESSTALWFVLERLDPMPVEALIQAGGELIGGLKQFSPGLVATQFLFRESNPAGMTVG